VAALNQAAFPILQDSRHDFAFLLPVEGRNFFASATPS